MPFPCCQQDFLLLKRTGIYLKLIIEFHALLFLFVRGSSKSKRGLEVFQISQKERLFLSLMTAKWSWKQSHMWSPFLYSPNETFWIINLCILSNRSFTSLPKNRNSFIKNGRSFVMFIIPYDPSSKRHIFTERNVSKYGEYGDLLCKSP